MSVFDYQLSRSRRRKTLAIVIRRGEVKVMAPDFVPLHVVEDFVDQRQQWIVNKLEQQQQYQQVKAQFEKQYTKGEKFLYFGEAIELNVVSGVRSWVDLQGTELVVCLSSRLADAKRQQSAKRQVQNWYKKQMTDYLHRYLIDFANQVGVDYSDVKVRSYKRRWGSCSAHGVLSFNYLLLMAPKFVVDYVIVHELCHRVHMNHSDDFWALVSSHCPDYRIAKQWLIEHQEQMQL